MKHKKRNIGGNSNHQCFFFYTVLCLSHYKLQDKQERENHQRDAYILKFTSTYLHHYIAQDAQADAISYGITQHHSNHSDKRGESLGDIIEFYLLHRVNHQHAHHNQGTTCGSRRNEQEKRRQQEGCDEQESGNQ